MKTICKVRKKQLPLQHTNHLTLSTKHVSLNTIRVFSVVSLEMMLSMFLLAIIPFRSNAFCGFYVAKADASLFNKTSQVILVRDGSRSIITMSSDFEGDVKDFAMVVPVPVVLQRDEIKTVSAQIFNTLDAYSGPRLVEYYDENPCQEHISYELDQLSAVPMESRASITSDKDEEKKYTVKIEARYTVDEYDVLLLSAQESSGLERWLTANGYKIPAGAREVLQPYINSGMKFFVVKVNMEQLKKKGTSFLSPLQISFNSPKFMLPIRLGMANSKGSQDMIVYAFSHEGRIETTNYRTVKVPTDKNVPEFVQNYFGQFYVDTYRGNRRQQGNANVYLEYAWDVSGSVSQYCDPCTGAPPMLSDLMTAGVSWVQQYHYGYNGNVFFTRLHVTYDREHFPQDLVFEETPNKENFQARYIITHPAQGDFTCDAGKKYMEDVRKRRSRELQQLAMLTGWETSGYAPYVNTFNFYPEEAPAYHINAIPDYRPINKSMNGDTAGNHSLQQQPNKIEQESFSVPFVDEVETNGGGNNMQWIMIGASVLVLFLLRMKRKAGAYE